jgi:hypothetical protein
MLEGGGLLHQRRSSLLFQKIQVKKARLRVSRFARNDSRSMYKQTKRRDRLERKEIK